MLRLLLAFAFALPATAQVVINEVNYNSAPTFAPNDWVELHNVGSGDLDVSGYTFRDGDDTNGVTVPAGTTLEAGGFLVLCNSLTRFASLYQNDATCFAEFDFNLANSGELIRLFDGGGNLVDVVTYDDESPWPLEPDGSGPTLSLLDPNADNALPSAWGESGNIGGTPGAVNQVDLAETLVINELNYNSVGTFDPRDWLEVYNPSDIPLDLSGWRFQDTDSDTVYVFPDGALIPEDGYLVLCRDASAFNAVYQGLATCAGAFGFGLSNDGEQIRLLNRQRVVVDSLTFDVAPPWPAEPNGTGPTLELIDPSADNTDPANWEASGNVGGTPGLPNDFPVDSETETVPNVGLQLLPPYPNPSTGATTLTYTLDAPARITLRVHDLLGRVVATLDAGPRPAGRYDLTWAADVPAGVYVAQLTSGTTVSSRRLVKLR
ncbi:MAG: lamin tail domain-containing protein [Bacteroidota bacterium]